MLDHKFQGEIDVKVTEIVIYYLFNYLKYIMHIPLN